MDIQISEITESDIAELTAVMTRAFDDDAQKHLGESKGGPPGYGNGDFFRKWLFGQTESVGFKAVSNEHVVGGVIVWIVESGENTLGVIFVDPHCQDGGVGSRIWQFVEARYPEAKSWQLGTPSYAIKNHHFYEKCGFLRTEVIPEEDGLPWDSWVYRKEMHTTTPNEHVLDHHATEV